MPWLELKGLLPGRGPGLAPGRGDFGVALAAGACGVGACGVGAWGPGSGADRSGADCSGADGSGADRSGAVGALSRGAGVASGAAGVGESAFSAAAAEVPLRAGPGLGAEDAAGLADDARSGVLVLGPDPAGGFSRILRTTGGSMVDDADLTNSPWSFRWASSSLLSTPSSLASS